MNQEQAVRVVLCTPSHASEIQAIFNDAILNTTALWEYAPRSLEDVEAWLRQKQAASFPVFGIVDATDRLVSFGSYGPFRHFPGYKYTVEHSVYVAPSERGRGFGKLTLLALIESARLSEYRTMIAGIDADNEASIRLHRSLGFEHTGTISAAGYKFGRWLDLAFYQLVLPGPLAPVEG